MSARGTVTFTRRWQVEISSIATSRSSGLGSDSGEATAVDASDELDDIGFSEGAETRLTNACKAGDGIRTHDNHVGNVVLYQLSYTRDKRRRDGCFTERNPPS